ncbi:MAG: OmpL47-type beta-barrel domain-containing protein, partial [Candidatus Odinarchaeota archaeon]
TLEVNVTDVHGNTAIASIIFYVRDTIPPEVAITSPANGETFEYTAGGNDVEYAITTMDPSEYTVTVVLNGDIVADYTVLGADEITFSDILEELETGTYTLTATAKDCYDNEASVSIVFTVEDTTPPLVSITSPANGETFEFIAGGTTVDYTYGIYDESDYTVTVYLNWTEMPDTSYFEELFVANYFLEVNATDIYGNTAIAVIPFYVRDTVAPTVEISSPLEGETFMYVSGGTTVNYEYSVQDESSYTVTVKLNGAIMPDTGFLPDLAIGDYTLEVIAVDLHGNIGSASILFLVRDLFPPVTTLDIGEPKYLSDLLYVTDETPFTLEATDDSSGVQVTLYRVFNETHTSDWLTYTGPFYLLSLADGNYTVEYYSIDNAGNAEEIQQASVTLFSWDYVFEQVCTENIILKIDTDNRFFQFISPDKDYGIREATCMKILKHVIIIKHEDSELKLLSIAIDTRKNFCLVFATDLITGERYRLVGTGYGSDQGWWGHSWYCHKHHNHHHHKIHMHRHHHCHC